MNRIRFLFDTLQSVKTELHKTDDLWPQDSKTATAIGHLMIALASLTEVVSVIIDELATHDLGPRID